jgi:hypothetical protein
LTRYYTEAGLVWNYYKSSRKSKECFENAKQVTGLVATLTGKMGVRTKFQTFQTAQLVLEANSKTGKQIFQFTVTPLQKLLPTHQVFLVKWMMMTKSYFLNQHLLTNRQYLN